MKKLCKMTATFISLFGQFWAIVRFYLSCGDCIISLAWQPVRIRPVIRSRSVLSWKWNEWKVEWFSGKWIGANRHESVGNGRDDDVNDLLRRSFMNMISFSFHFSEPKSLKITEAFRLQVICGSEIVTVDEATELFRPPVRCRLSCPSCFDLSFQPITQLSFTPGSTKINQKIITTINKQKK